MTAPADPSPELDRLAQEFVDRARRGEAPSIETYAAQNPDLATDIRELFPVLAVVEGLKGPSGRRRSTLHDGAWGTPPGGTPPPERIGSWHIVRELGHGGMGTVYEGVGGDQDRERVAVKVIHRHLLDRPEFIARFLQEAEAGRRVSHPNVVETLETGLLELEDGGEAPYLTLEYVEGQNLRALLDEVEVVPERLCRLVARRLAAALGAVHAAGLVHRDVKPENVVITADETVKLMDLGVAVLQEGMNRLSQTGQFVGSLLYAAPEQITGGLPDPRWDLYALGILLYELSTGRHPARALGVRWLERSAGRRPSTSPRDANPRLSPFFDALVRTLLSRDPDRRLSSASEVAEILEGGERSSWWRTRRRDVAPPASTLVPVDRPTGFVGRAAERERLDVRLADAREGRGCVVLLLGDAGVGKTRLIHEWLAASLQADEELQVIVVPHGPGVVGGGEGGLAAALLEALGTADLEGRIRQLLASRSALAAPLARHLRGSGLSGPGRDLDPSSLDTAYLHLLRALAQEQALVLVLEDLHFASAEARSRFLLFARAFQRDRALVVGSARTVPAPTWAAELDRLPRAERLVLEGLDAEACRALVREAARGGPHLDERMMKIADRTDRNPYLILEFVRDWMHRKPTAPGERSREVTLPATVKEFIACRLAALEPADRELLEAASCCGHEFDPLVVASAAGLGRIAALKRFGRLERLHGLLRPLERHYRFQHHLVQEVLYAEVHTALRETWHAAIGDALEREEGILLSGPRALALTTHFLEGGQPERARPYVRRALEHLRLERQDTIRNATLARRVLSVEGLLTGEDRAVALHHTALADSASHEEEAAAAHIEEALGLARALDAKSLEVDLLFTQASIAEGRGDRAGLHEACRAAVAGARALADGSREALIRSYWGLMLREENRAEEAEACFRAGFEALGDEPEPRYEASLVTNLARMRVYWGDFEEGRRLLARAEALAHSVGDHALEARVILTLGHLAVRTCRYEEAVRLGMRSVELLHQVGHRHTEMELGNVGYCLSLLGRFDEAYERITEAVSLAEEGDRRFAIAQSLLRRGRLLVERGRLAAARADLQVSFDAARVLQLPLLVKNAAEALAEALTLSGRVSEAEQVIGEASSFIGPEAPRNLAGARALVAELVGRHADAREHRERSAKQFPPDSQLFGFAQLALGRLRYHLGEREAAAEPLRAVHAWARERGIVRHQVPAEAFLAAVGSGDVLAARVALEQHEASLSVFERLESHWVLWEATKERGHLLRARGALATWKEHARPEDRGVLVANVDLHRRVASAVS